jgi:hypothetical protein
MLVQFPEKKGMTTHFVENIFSKDLSSMKSKYNSTNALGRAVYLCLSLQTYLMSVKQILPLTA